MNQQNHGQSSLSSSYVPMKRKRGRPRKDENIVQRESLSVPTGSDSLKNIKQTAATNIELDNVMVGQVVSGVIEAAFDAGYLLNVRVGNSETQLRGVIFLPGRVAPVTSENDVAPNVTMVKRKELPLPGLIPQNQSFNNTPSLSQKIKQPVGTSQAPSLHDQQVLWSEHHSDVSFPPKNRPLSIMGTEPSLPKKDNSITSGMLQETSKTGKDIQSGLLTSQIEFDKGVKKDEVCEASGESQGLECDLGANRNSEPISGPVDKVLSTGYSSKEIACEHRTASNVSNEIKHSSIQLEHTLGSAEFKTVPSDQISKSVDNSSENDVLLQASIPKDLKDFFSVDNAVRGGSSNLNERPTAATGNAPGLELNPSSDIFQPMTLFPSEAFPAVLKPAPEVAGTLGANEGTSIPQDTTAKLLSDTSKGLGVAQLDRNPAVITANSFLLELGPALEISQPLLSLVGSAVPLESKSVADGTIAGNVESTGASIPAVSNTPETNKVSREEEELLGLLPRNKHGDPDVFYL